MKQKPHFLANYNLESEIPGKWTFQTVGGKLQTQSGKLLSWTDGRHKTHTIHLDRPFDGDPADITLLTGELLDNPMRESFEVVFYKCCLPGMETIYCVNSRKPV